MKIANDIRLLGSGPRCGLGELLLPENEPGSSIMPGKVNPTQSEAMTLVPAAVMGNDAAMELPAQPGEFRAQRLNPVMMHNFLHSVDLLTGTMRSFADYCLRRASKVNRRGRRGAVANSLMLVTALNQHIGYDKAAAIARSAHLDGLTLREAALASGHVTEEDFDTWVRPADMTRPGCSPFRPVRDLRG